MGGYPALVARGNNYRKGENILLLFAYNVCFMGSAAAKLRAELVERAKGFAIKHALPHCLSYGEETTVCFEAYGARRHGNFHPSSYRRIVGEPASRVRLQKVHTTARRQLPSSENGRRRELDTCTSSDALLMNLFCHPASRRCKALGALLGIDIGWVPEFGLRARVPLTDGKVDRTEIDMRIGDLLVEAKLTEGDFQRARKGTLDRYRDFDVVFEKTELPQTDEEYASYQLIRGFLAAHAQNGSFFLLTDARRPDLIERWYATLRCVKILELRVGCKVLTWQELAHAAPRSLRVFLSEKYGL